jgi:hypothetical protein
MAAIDPARKWDHDVTQRALDELFELARKYKTSAEYHEFLKFVARFRFYSPYNAMLIHMQMPDARFVATPHRWLAEYGRQIKPGERPLIILQPMGPVMCVFDVSQTQADEGALPLPAAIEQPFEGVGGQIGSELDKTIQNAKRDGVEISPQQAGSQNAGAIRPAKGNRHQQFLVKQRPRPEYMTVPVRYELLLNSSLSREATYATIAHELAHLYCGHLGTLDSRWWPDRQSLSHELREFEAESVSYLLCSRLGIENPSAEYLSGYIKKHNDTPKISLDCVIKSAGLIEQMGRERLKPRSTRKAE